MFRHLIAVVALAALGVLAWHLTETRKAANRVLGKSRSMERTISPEAGAIGYRVVATRYPFSGEAHEARRRLWHIAGASQGGEARAALLAPATQQRDWKRLIMQVGDPYVTEQSLAALAAVLALLGLFLPRSRVRGSSLLLLCGLAGLVLLTQTPGGLEWLRRADSGTGQMIYAAAPWAFAALVLVAGFLLLVPRAGRHPSRLARGWSPG